MTQNNKEKVIIIIIIVLFVLCFLFANEIFKLDFNNGKNIEQNESFFLYVENIPVEDVQKMLVMNSFTPVNFEIESTDGKGIATEIYEIVDEILETNEYPDEYSNIDDVAIALGVYYGQAICNYYDWTWKLLGQTSGENYEISVVSPEKNYSIQPILYMKKILTNNNIGVNGKNDNTILLLFNMLDDIDSNPSEMMYTPLS